MPFLDSCKSRQSKNCVIMFRIKFHILNNKNYVSMNTNNVIHDNDLLMHLNVCQVKALIKSVFQESLSIQQKQSEILSIEEVSELTGYKKATIYKLTHERKIPYHKPAHGGRRIFFKKDEINQWLQSNHIETHEDFF